MRKVTATVLWNHKSNQLFNLTVTTRDGVDICLVRYTPENTPGPYRYNLPAFICRYKLPL